MLSTRVGGIKFLNTIRILKILLHDMEIECNLISSLTKKMHFIDISGLELYSKMYCMCVRQ